MPILYAKIKARKDIDPEYAEKHKSYAVKYRARNLDKERERQRLSKQRSRDKDRDGYNASMRQYNAQNTPIKERVAKLKRERHPDYEERKKSRLEFNDKDYQKYWKLKQQYGITLHDYNDILLKQNNCCKICGVHKDNAGIKGLSADHCHDQGHVRGLLCSKCNFGLGSFKDDITRLQNAIEYIIQHTKE